MGGGGGVGTKEEKGREGKGREGKGREGKGREGKGRRRRVGIEGENVGT